MLRLDELACDPTPLSLRAKGRLQDALDGLVTERLPLNPFQLNSWWQLFPGEFFHFSFSFGSVAIPTLLAVIDDDCVVDVQPSTFFMASPTACCLTQSQST